MIYMVSTIGRGGVRSVVESLRTQGFFEEQDIHWVASHDEGSILRRLRFAASAGVSILWACLLGRLHLLHLHSAMRGSFWRKSIYLSIARLFGVPVVFHVHGSQMESFHGSLGRVGRFMFSRTLQRAQAVVVLSRSWRRFILDVAPGAQVFIVPNAVSIPPQAAPRAQSGPIQVTFLGLIGQRKGIFDLVETIAGLPVDVQETIRLNIGGNGAIDRLRQVVAQSGVRAEVRILGWVVAEGRESLLAETDIFVLPSYNEGSPMALLEAMARGLAVISTVVGGIPELVESDKMGILVKPGDKQALATALMKLLESPQLRHELGAAARERIELHFSPSVMLEGLDKVYRHALGATDRADGLT